MTERVWVFPDDPGYGHFHHPGGQFSRDERMYGAILGVVMFSVAFVLYLRRARFFRRAARVAPDAGQPGT